MIRVNMLRLLTFGGLALERRDGSTPPRVRRQRLAILAVIAAAGDRGVSRERICGLLWPETSETRARHALRQALYALGQEVQADIIQADLVLRLDHNLLAADVTEFQAAIAARDWAGAASLVTGPFLHGFYLPSASSFERWVEEERASLHVASTRALLTLAKDATSAGAHEQAAEWWRRLTALEPLSGRFALGYLKALASHGDRAAALAFAREHESVVRRELEADADPEIRQLEAELRALPSPAIERHAPPHPVASAAASPWAGKPDEPAPAQRQDAAPARNDSGRNPRRSWIVTAAAGLALVAVAAVLAANLWGRVLDRRGTRQPTFAVGLIREDGIPDSLRIGGVLTDMLSTNLARVSELSVLATSRLFELMLSGQDTLATGYSEAARRAGATEILQGRLLSGPQWGLALELQRVDLGSGIVKGAYRVAAADRYALVDSMTMAITRDLRLHSPVGSIADATTDSPIAYRLYEEGLRAYYQYDRSAARRLMQAALQEDSTFAMAAYYNALLLADNEDVVAPRSRALRLAVRAPDRERLRITASMLALNMEPAAVAVAESLSTRFPDDPRSFALLAQAYWFRGDWREAVRSIERAIALDSASELVEQQLCHLCDDYYQLAEIYFWWDSLSAVERTAQRFLRARPGNPSPWDILTRVAGVRGDTAAMMHHRERLYQIFPGGADAVYTLRQLTLMEGYDQVEKDVQRLVRSPRADEVSEGRWILSIALRNQGRLEDAQMVAREQRPMDPDHLLEALVALEAGNNGKAIAIFDTLARRDLQWQSAVRARQVTWDKTRYAMALIAANDTARLPLLADTIESWGQKSLYGRDRRAHHYVRGMLLVAEQHDVEAVEELRQAIHSPTSGFTRINYELGKVLLRLDRAAEAVPVVRAALHGGIDGSNLYVTRTELHELLAQAFERLGNRDSAAVHYRAVVRAWARSDPRYRERLDRARKWLVANAPPLTSGMQATGGATSSLVATVVSGEVVAAATDRRRMAHQRRADVLPTNPAQAAQFFGRRSSAPGGET
jgi:DNA-binding SARP family transcriptional activator/tetratricopeptide (TPR) repeat protein